MLTILEASSPEEQNHVTYIYIVRSRSLSSENHFLERRPIDKRAT